MWRFVSRIGLPINGKVFVGFVFVLSGAVIAWSGYSHARELWFKVSQFFPIQLPNDIADRTLVSFPLIAKELISAVSSLCAILIGAMWFFSGWGEVFRSWKHQAQPADFRHPELVAESVRTAEAQYWRASSVFARLLGRVWGRTRYISPISYEFFGKILRSSVKILLIGLLTAVAFYLVRIFPLLLNRYFQVTLNIAVPSPAPLYLLMGIALLVNVLIVFSLVPIRKQAYGRSQETLAVRGRGDPQIFFALLEEGCRLLTPTGASARAPIRLVSENRENVKATLVENHPEPVGSLARPGGYLCLPLIFFPVTMGFSRLIHFHRPVTEMPYQVFLKVHALDYLVEVLFGLGLIIVGLYFAEWARRLFDVRKYRSDVVLCHSLEESAVGPPSDVTGAPQELEWKLMDGVDDSFAGWAKDPRSGKSFQLEVFWAEVFSESASVRSHRYLVRMRDNDDLNRSMWRILRLPFFVNFEAEHRQLGSDGE
jgi:hypothetical protein